MKTVVRELQAKRMHLPFYAFMHVLFFSPPYSCLPLIAVTFVQFDGQIDSNLSDCAE